MADYARWTPEVIHTLEAEREKACVLCIRPGVVLSEALGEMLNVVSLREELIHRLEGRGAQRTCLLVDDELRAIRELVRVRPALLVETEFQLTRLRSTLGENPSEEARSRFWVGLQRMPHLDNPLVYGCLPSLMPSKAVWRDTRRLLVLDEEESCQL